MKTSVVAMEPLDLLRQKRLELGLPAAGGRPSDPRRLLLAGLVLGGGLLALTVGAWLLIGLRQAMVSAEIAKLGAIPGYVKDLQGRNAAARGRLDKIQASNDGLAKGMVAVASGSALLAQMSELTPEGVQLAEASVTGTSLSGTSLALKGSAMDPEAFRRINGLQLLMAYSPMFKPDGVRLVKASREATPAAAKPATGTAPAPGPATPPVSFELGAEFAVLPPAQQLRELKRLRADGMARRLQTLQDQGVLP